MLDLIFRDVLFLFFSHGIEYHDHVQQKKLQCNLQKETLRQNLVTESDKSIYFPEF